MLAAKAQHHSNCVEKLNDYLSRQSEDTDKTVRCVFPLSNNDLKEYELN